MHSTLENTHQGLHTVQSGAIIRGGDDSTSGSDKKKSGHALCYCWGNPNGAQVPGDTFEAVNLNKTLTHTKTYTQDWQEATLISQSPRHRTAQTIQLITPLPHEMRTYPFFWRFAPPWASVSGPASGGGGSAGSNAFNFSKDELALVWWMKTPPARFQETSSDNLAAGSIWWQYWRRNGQKSPDEH